MLLQWGEQDECPIYWSRLGWQERRTWMGADDGDDDVDYNRPVDVEYPEGGAGTTQQRPQAGKKKTRKVPQGGVRFSGDICYNKRPLRDIVPSR